jgi:hypothetical protein
MYTEIQIQEYICDKGCMLLYVQGVEIQRQERIYTRIGTVHRDTDNRGEYGERVWRQTVLYKGSKDMYSHDIVRTGGYSGIVGEYMHREVMVQRARISQHL